MTALTIQTLKESLNNQYKAALTNFFQGDDKKTLKFLSAVGYCAQSTPKLLDCTQESIIGAFMKCAEYNLFPSSVSGEVYILPYFNKGKMEAQFQLGYKGIISLLYRAGIGSIYTDIVRKNDKFRVIAGLNPNIEHEYALENRGEAIGVYAVCSFNGEKIWKYMAKDEVLAFKKFSKGGDTAYSPWNASNDPELNMWRKTIIKQLSKNLSLTEEVYTAIAEDNKEASIEDFHKNQLARPSTNLGDLLLSTPDPLPVDDMVQPDAQDASTPPVNPTVG